MRISSQKAVEQQHPLPSVSQPTVTRPTASAAADSKPPTLAQPEISQAARNAGRQSQHTSGQFATGVSARLIARANLRTPSEMAADMTGALTKLGRDAASGKFSPAEIQKKVDAYQSEYAGEASFPALGHLWTAGGEPMRKQLAAAAVALADAAPNAVLRGFVMSSESNALRESSVEVLRAQVQTVVESPRNRWQNELGSPDVSTMGKEQLVDFMEKNIVATRTRRAETGPLEYAVANAQMSGDAAAVKAAAQQIMALPNALEDMGPILKFYEGLAQ